MLSVPSVATIAGTRKTVTTTPLTMPRTSAEAEPEDDRAGGVEGVQLEHVRRRSRRPGPIVASTERSTFRVMTTRASPIAATAMTDARTATWLMLRPSGTAAPGG